MINPDSQTPTLIFQSEKVQREQEPPSASEYRYATSAPVQTRVDVAVA
jgi:hypothetical protein